MMDDEARKLRERMGDLQERFDQLPTDTATPSPNRLFLTAVKTHYPTVAGAYYCLQPQRLSGSQAEGGTSTLDDAGPNKTFGLNIGRSIPPIGTLVIASVIDNVWVFRYSIC